MAAPEEDQLLHELRVHQFELEMQNEALRIAQVALELSRDRYVDLYEFAPVGYLTLTREGLVSEANLVATAFLGADRKLMISRRFVTFVVPEERDRWHRHFFRAMQSEGKQICEIALLRGDATRVHVQADCQRVSWEDELPVMRVVLTDITERKRAEALRAEAELARAAALEEAERLARLRHEFLDNLSHEIRKPLDAILGMAHLVKRGGVTLPQAEQLEKIDAAGRQLLGIINGVLDLAKRDPGKAAPSTEVFSLRECMGTITSLVSHSAAENGLTLRLNMDAPDCALVGDTTRLRQTLVNSLGDAIKFAQCGGIDLHVHVLDEREDAVLLRFEVIDSGTGMDSGNVALSVRDQGSKFWMTAWLDKAAGKRMPKVAG